MEGLLLTAPTPSSLFNLSPLNLLVQLNTPELDPIYIYIQPVGFPISTCGKIFF